MTYIAGTNTNSINERISGAFLKILGKTSIEKHYNNTTAEASSNDVDVVIVTALDDPELQAVKKVFGCIEVKPRIISNARFYYSAIDVGDKNISIACAAQKNMGMVSAAILTTIGLLGLRPQLVAMPGVCAAISDGINVGDIVVSSSVYNYEEGKWNNDKFKPDYRQHRICSGIEDIVKDMAQSKTLKRSIQDSWQQLAGAPKTELNIHVETTASGAAVIADENKILQITEHQRKLSSIDMEAFSIAQASHELSADGTKWIVAKAVQDHANSVKNDDHRYYAAHVSAQFIREFIKSYFMAQ